MNVGGAVQLYHRCFLLVPVLLQLLAAQKTYCNIKSVKQLIDYFRIPHNTLCLPPKFYITYCLKMLLGKCNTPRSI